RTIETRRKQEGSPPSFHFVHMDVFLDWHFERRQAYVKEAQRRFELLSKEPEDFLKIRHELDSEDWESADLLIKNAEGKPWTDEQQNELKDMKKYLREHRGTGELAREGETDDEVLGEMQELLDAIPYGSVR